MVLKLNSCSHIVDAFYPSVAVLWVKKSEEFVGFVGYLYKNNTSPQYYKKDGSTLPIKTKTGSYVIDGQAMRGDLIVSLKKFTPFLLQTVGGDSTNVIQVQLVVYDSSGQKETGIQMDQAVISTAATSFQKNRSEERRVGKECR